MEANNANSQNEQVAGEKLKKNSFSNQVFVRLLFLFNFSTQPISLLCLLSIYLALLEGDGDYRKTTGISQSGGLISQDY